MREDWPAVSRVTSADRQAVQQAIEGLCPQREKISTSVDLPVSHPCRRALAYAAEEAQRMDRTYIEPEHLLLGILRENGPEGGLLNQFGIELENARLTFGAPAAAPGPGRDTLAKLLAAVPEERLEAATRILAGLSSAYFALGGVSPEGTFSYAFGALT